MLFSEKLRNLRKQLNLTQEDLAEKINVSRQAITKWESGEGIPDIENLKQLSILFDTTIDELIKEEKEVVLEGLEEYSIMSELEINHTKHFDIHLGKGYECNIKPITEEKIKIECYSKIEDLNEILKIKFDDLYNRIDIFLKSKRQIEDMKINLYIPEKYIDEIELSAKLKCLNIEHLNIPKLEYDGELKYFNGKGLKGRIVLNTTKCDVEAKYDSFDGVLELNTFNSTTRVEIPKGTKYKTILKGIRNEFIDSVPTEESNNIIELNGLNSKCIIIEK